MREPGQFGALRGALVVACHDAGAANLVFAWLRAAAASGEVSPQQWRMVLDGPALRLWQDEPVPGAVLVADLEDALRAADTLFSGTGWGSSLEHRARVLARERGIASIAAIDHWVNYRERFIRDGSSVLPDRIWVADRYAYAEASRCFPDMPVDEMPNLYLQSVVTAITPLYEQRELLYVLEPVRATWAEEGTGVFQALDFFALHVGRIVDDTAAVLRLRPHPSDPAGKYDAWIAAHPDLRAVLDDSRSLAASISRARWVFGAETFAMVVALAAGRQVVSTLPPHGHRCRLPHEQIIHLRDLISAREGTAP